MLRWSRNVALVKFSLSSGAFLLHALSLSVISAKIIIIIVIINKVSIKVTLNKVIAGALYTVSG